MSHKKYTHCWIKGNRLYLGLRGTKRGLARDLIWHKNIRLSKQDCEKLDIKRKCDIDRVCDYEWADFLESKGWQWKKLDYIL